MKGGMHDHRNLTWALRRLTLFGMIAVLLLTSPPLEAAEEEYGVRIYVDCDGVPHVSITLPVDQGLAKIAAPVDVFPGTLEASLDGRTLPAVYDNGTIYIAVDAPGVLRVTYAGVTQLNEQGELYFKLNTAGVEVVMSECTILTSIPQNLADVQSTENGTLLLKLAGPDELRYIPLTPTQPPAGEAREVTSATTTGVTTTAPTSTTTPPREQEPGEQGETTKEAASEAQEAQQEAGEAGVSDTATAGTQEPGAEGAGSETPGEGGGGLPVTLMVGGVLVVLAAGVVFALSRRGR